MEQILCYFVWTCQISHQSQADVLILFNLDKWSFSYNLTEWTHCEVIKLVLSVWDKISLLGKARVEEMLFLKINQIDSKNVSNKISLIFCCSESVIFQDPKPSLTHWLKWLNQLF